MQLVTGYKYEWLLWIHTSNDIVDGLLGAIVNMNDDVWLTAIHTSLESML